MVQLFYQKRQQIALLSFGNQRCEWRLSASKAPLHIDALLERIQAGGGTPLRAVLFELEEYIVQRQTRYAKEQQRIFLLTDARSRDQIEALQFDLLLATEVYVLDTEKGQVKLGKARSLSNTLQAHYIQLF